MGSAPPVTFTTLETFGNSYFKPFKDKVVDRRKTLGTPDDSIWPGFTQLPNYTDKFPKWPRRDIINVIGEQENLDSDGEHLLRRMLLYSPENRITCITAMNNQYFRDVAQYLPPEM
eukprot:sb/3476619/